MNVTRILPVPAIRTNHAAITLALSDIGEIKGPGICKMNVWLLDDENYLKHLQINSGAHAREARVGQSPILMEYGQPLFVWLSRD